MNEEMFEAADGPNGAPPGEFQMPSIDELLKALENMDMSEESKQELRDNLLARAQGEGFGSFAQASQVAQPAGLAPDMLILFLLIAGILLVFGFFGYKLYDSLMARERRKEEKKRQKQQRKKK